MSGLRCVIAAADGRDSQGLLSINGAQAKDCCRPIAPIVIWVGLFTLRSQGQFPRFPSLLQNLQPTFQSRNRVALERGTPTSSPSTGPQFLRPSRQCKQPSSTADLTPILLHTTASHANSLIAVQTSFKPHPTTTSTTSKLLGNRCADLASRFANPDVSLTSHPIYLTVSSKGLELLGLRPVQSFNHHSVAQ